jgi:IS5 family transposase
MTIGKNHGVITGITSLDGQPHDVNTVSPILSQYNRINPGFNPKLFIGDQGYRGTHIDPSLGIKFITFNSSIDDLPPNELRASLKRLNRRNSIEAKISHLKNDFRLGRNELRGVLGDKINPLLAAAASNFALYARNVISERSKIFKTPFKNKQKRVKTKSVPFSLKKPIQTLL